MASKTSRPLTSLILCGLLAPLVEPAVAQGADPAQALLDSQFVLDLGAFIVNSKLKASLNGGSGNNPEIDFDRNFGRARDATRWRADVLWRITPRHHLRLMHFDNANSRMRTLSEDVPWGDYTFHANASTTFDFKQQTTALLYEYAFQREANYEVAASLGVHYSNTKLGLSGLASITHPDGTVSNSVLTTKTSSVPEPLPVIGVRAGWVLAPQWFAGAEVQVFKAHYDGYIGQWADLRAAVTWMHNRNFGVGLGIDSFTNNVRVTKDNFDGRLKTGYTGAMLYLTGAF